MSTANRFGRRVPLPSTRDILHELRLMMSADRIKELEKELESINEKARIAGLAAAPAAS